MRALSTPTPAPDQRLHDPFRVAGLDVAIRARVRLQERAHDALHERAGKSRHHADQQPSLRLPVQRVHRVLDLLHPTEDPVDLGVELHALLGRSEPALHAVEQAQLAIRLELGQRFAHRRLRDVQRGGCGADGAVLDDGFEHLDLPQVDPPPHP